MYIMSLEFKKFRKAMEIQLNNLNNKINNLSIEDILDNHVKKFEASKSVIEEHISSKEAEIAKLIEDRNKIDSVRDNNRAIKAQIDDIKSKAMNIDVKSLGDTQRFIEELRKDVVVYNKEKYDQTVFNINKLKCDIEKEREELAVYTTKIAKFVGVKTALGLNNVDYN